MFRVTTLRHRINMIQIRMLLQQVHVKVFIVAAGKGLGGEVSAKQIVCDMYPFILRVLFTIFALHFVSCTPLNIFDSLNRSIS